MKSLRAGLLFVLVQLSLAIAVVEDVSEKSPAPPSITTSTLNTLDKFEKMQQYIMESKKHDRKAGSSEQQPTMDSYVEAYRIFHENYQSGEEMESTKVALENSDSVPRRQKRNAQPVDVVKFELADAKISSNGDNMQSGFYPMDMAKHKRDGQAAAEESRTIKITHPIPAARRIHPMLAKPLGTLPLGVRKAISLVLKSDEHRSLYKSVEDQRYGAPKQFHFGDKLPQGNGPSYNQINPIEDKAQWAIPEYNRPKRLYMRPQVILMSQPYAQYVPVQTAQAYEQPKINYVIKEVPVPVPVVNNLPIPVETLKNAYKAAGFVYDDTQPSSVSVEAPATSQKHAEEQKELEQQYNKQLEQQQHQHHQQHQQQQQQHQQQLQAEQQKHFDEQKQLEAQHLKLQHDKLAEEQQAAHQEARAKQKAYQFDNSYQNEGSSLAALSALIGKEPTHQLQGLTQLLKHENKRPQDSTSPILFHPTEPTQFESTASVKQQTSHAYPAISNYYGHHHQMVTHAPPVKEFTPITEPSVDDVAATHQPSLAQHSVVLVTPTPHLSTVAPPVAHKSAQSSLIKDDAYNYGHSHDGLSGGDIDGLVKDSHQYASGYAFGYRVRDYHTGNDFGHSQNRDLDGVTRGEYHILLPDGRVQNVHYRADEQGFHADVSYETIH